MQFAGGLRRKRQKIHSPNDTSLVRADQVIFTFSVAHCACGSAASRRRVRGVTGAKPNVARAKPNIPGAEGECHSCEAECH